MWSRISILLNPMSTCRKSEEDIVLLTPRPRWRHPCIIAADYLHSTAAGAIHLAHSDDESIHQKWVDDLLTYLLSWNFASLHVAFALKFYARCWRFLHCVYCVACVVNRGVDPYGTRGTCPGGHGNVPPNILEVMSFRMWLKWQQLFSVVL